MFNQATEAVPMSYFRVFLTTLSLCLLSLISVNTQADEVIQKTVTTTTAVQPTTPSSTVIVTPVPSAKEVVVAPEGYVNCFNVQAGWYKNTWVPQHRVCQYQNTPGQKVTYQGVAWVDGYWACMQYTDTACTKWEWIKGHWVKTLEVY